VQADFIFIAQSCGDPALCVLRTRVSNFALGEDQNAPGWSKFNGRTQSSDSGTNDQEVSLREVGWHVLEWYHCELP
jgi:hypothetical protein